MPGAGGSADRSGGRSATAAGSQDANGGIGASGQRAGACTDRTDSSIRCGSSGEREPAGPQQPHAEGTSARTSQPLVTDGHGEPGSAPRPGGPPLPLITKRRAFDPDSFRFWAKGQMDSGTRLDLLSLFILAVASLLLPIIGFIGGAGDGAPDQGIQDRRRAGGVAAIPVLGFVLMIALRWPNDPTFSQTMTARSPMR